MASTMDHEKVELMKQLQMSDLGSDRREYISTREDKRYGQQYSYEEIESSRAFHKEKTASGRQALAHQPALNAWSTLAQKVNDTDSIEKLDPLMHGQSHRARLMEKIKEQGGQQYGEGYGKNSQAKSENHHPFSPVSSGRGGGIARTRGRGRGLGPRGAPEGIAMRSHSVALPTGAALTRQDPALDSNNGGPVTAGRNYRGVRGRGPRGHPTRPTPLLRRPAPMEDFSKNLGSGVEFMQKAQAQGYTKPTSHVTSTSPSRLSPSPARRSSPSQSVSPSRRSVTLTGPVARSSFPPSSPKAVKQAPPEKQQATATILKPFAPASKLPAAEKKAAPKARPLEQPLSQATTLKPFAPVPKPPAPRQSPPLKERSLEQAKIQKTLSSTPKPSVTETNPAAKNRSPEPSADISLIDFSSEDETPEPQPGPSTQVPPRVPTGPLLDLLDFEDNNGLGLLTPNRSRISQTIENQLSGLEFEQSDPEHETVPQELRTVNSQATVMIDGLKTSSSSKEPVRISTPVKDISSQDEFLTPPGSKKSQAGSFIDHRSPQNSLSSGDSTQRAKETLPEENLSPRKSGPAVSEPPLQGFDRLQISEPPGLEFQANEPQTTASRTQPREEDVRPAPRHGGIGMLADSIHAVDVEHARTIGGARTIGVKPSHTNKINNQVTIEIQRASRTQSRMPSGTSTPMNQPSGLGASIYATDQKVDAASTAEGSVPKPQASFRSRHRLA
ncbi:hypothetical protein N7509_003172 [Penicillium cosmopolitanum]|uniref:Uncharacterized protein n=1 Tax=Penicillium cosmopolitanum TaxID=1131564 RepID=A0A9X0BB40_9EURO|nr:uncharacterized protein N7509_003172 [Penicillium cosmopolitanum]KAJ5403301.1 hypothetical protein N7509_003172 [Penicillium cosmopolitanum]